MKTRPLSRLIVPAHSAKSLLIINSEGSGAIAAHNVTLESLSTIVVRELGLFRLGQEQLLWRTRVAILPKSCVPGD